MKITSTNLYVLKELFKSSDRIQNRVDEVYYSHLNRLLKAGYIKVVDKRWLELTDLGKETVRKNPRGHMKTSVSFPDSGFFASLIEDAYYGHRWIELGQIKNQYLQEQIAFIVGEVLAKVEEYLPDEGDYIVALIGVSATWKPDAGLDSRSEYTYKFDVEWVAAD